MFLSTAYPYISFDPRKTVKNTIVVCFLLFVRHVTKLARQGRLTVVCPSAADLQRGQTTARPRCVQQAVSCNVLQALAVKLK